jgi:hypothetical protein
MEIKQNITSANSGDEEHTLSKAELRRLENEKRIKRIQELMELLEKLNEETQQYQNELWELLKVQIVLPPTRSKREKRIVREIADENESNTVSTDNNSKQNNLNNTGQTVVSSLPKNNPKIAMFEKFFKVVQEPIAPEPLLPILPAKPRARAISYDENAGNKKLVNFEIVDIFDLDDIDVEFVRNCLEKCDISGDIKLFRQVFIKKLPKDQQLVRFLGGRKYQCRRNDLWIDDHNGNYVKHVISKILEQSYLIVNDIEHYDMDKFLTNQEHINQLCDDKYVEKLMDRINDIIDIKS